MCCYLPASAGRSDLNKRAAHTLNSGMCEIGSCAEMVNWLALFAPGQW
jgi:hypothetical protein